MARVIQIRRDTSENWSTVNPTLAQGELGYEIDTGKLKIGDGVTAWNDLPYFGGETGIAHPAGEAGEIQFNLDGEQLGADSNLFWDNTNKYLGVGTNTPSANLHVLGVVKVDDGGIQLQQFGGPLPEFSEGYGMLYHGSDGEVYWQRADGSQTQVTVDKFMQLKDVTGELEDSSLLQVNDSKTGLVYTKVIFPNAVVAQAQRIDSVPYKTGLIIPYYEYPWDGNNGTWKSSFIEMITFLKEFHNVPVLVVVNPNSGPGTVVDTVWRRAIKMLRGAGCMVLGYVDTNYTNVTVESAESTIDDWKSLYPMVDGIFLDRMTSDDNTEHISYYWQLTQYAHSKGFCPVIGNAGAIVPSSYFLNWTADVIIVHENNTYPDESTLAGGDWEDSYREIPYWRKAALVWGQSTLDKQQFRMMQKYCGFVYITSSSDYTSQPDYLLTELFYCSLYDNPHPLIPDGFDFGSHAAYFTLQQYTTTGSTVTIDWSKGNKATITLTQDVTVSFADPPGACNLILLIQQDSSGGHTISFSGNIKWSSGLDFTPTQTANATDVVSFFFDGSVYYAIASYNFS